MAEPKGRARARRRLEEPEAPPPSLGAVVCEWWETYVIHGPGEVAGGDWDLTDDERELLWLAYELDPVAVRRTARGGPKAARRWSHVVHVGPKGTAKSDFAGGTIWLEMFGPVRFDGFDAAGELVAKPVNSPVMSVLAVKEGQAKHTYSAAAYIGANGHALNVDYGPIDVGDSWETSSRIIVPDHGRVERRSKAPDGNEGGKDTFQVLEEPHLWRLTSHLETYELVLREMVKRARFGTWALSVTNFYDPSQDTAARRAHRASQVRGSKTLWHCRQPSNIDQFSRKTEQGRREDIALAALPDKVLRQGLRDVYGSAMAWMDEDALLDTVKTVKDAHGRRFFFNMPAIESDRKAVDARHWQTLAVADRLESGDTIAVGFDGGRTRDATALIACRLSDLLIQPLRIWERPEAAKVWEVSPDEVELQLEFAMSTFRVVQLWCDPPHWQHDIKRWQRTWGEELVLEVPTNQDLRMGPILDSWFRSIDLSGLRHTGDEVLSRHVENAERIELPADKGWRLTKPVGVDPVSPRAWIDGHVAAALSHAAALAAISQGLDAVEDDGNFDPVQIW